MFIGISIYGYSFVTPSTQTTEFLVRLYQYYEGNKQNMKSYSSFI